MGDVPTVEPPADAQLRPDPSRTAAERLNDRIDEWPGVSIDEWRRGASWHDAAETVINWDRLLTGGLR